MTGCAVSEIFYEERLGLTNHNLTISKSDVFLSDGELHPSERFALTEANTDEAASSPRPHYNNLNCFRLQNYLELNSFTNLRIYIGCQQDAFTGHPIEHL